MKKKLIAFALVLFSTITLASCIQNNKEVKFEKYSSYQAQTTFSTKIATLPKKVEEYKGDYIYESTSYSENTTTTQYEDNEKSKDVIKEIKSNSNVKKVDYDKKMYTSSSSSNETSSMESATTKQKSSNKSTNEMILQKDGLKYVTIFKTDKAYSTKPSTNYDFDLLNKFEGTMISSLLNRSTVAALPKANVTYYIDNETYTLVAEYNSDNLNSTVTKKEIIQVCFKEDSIAIKTELNSIENQTNDNNSTTTIEEYENSQITVTYKDVKINFFEYEDYKCLDEEDE